MVREPDPVVFVEPEGGDVVRSLCTKLHHSKGDVYFNNRYAG